MTPDRMHIPTDRNAVKITAWDVCLDNASWRAPGSDPNKPRVALCHDAGDKLTLNWGGGYPGGVVINGGSGGVVIHSAGGPVEASCETTNTDFRTVSVPEGGPGATSLDGSSKALGGYRIEEEGMAIALVNEKYRTQPIPGAGFSHRLPRPDLKA